MYFSTKVKNKILTSHFHLYTGSNMIRVMVIHSTISYHVTTMDQYCFRLHRFDNPEKAKNIDASLNFNSRGKEKMKEGSSSRAKCYKGNELQTMKESWPWKNTLAKYGRGLTR